MLLIETIASRSCGWKALPLGIDAFLCRGASTKPLAVITAGIHGDEYEGPAAIADLIRHLHPEAMEGSVIAIPIANPMAFCVGQRTTPEDGLNLARTFPGDARGSVTQRLAASLFEDVARHADHLIDLHSGGVEYRFTPLAGFYGTPESENSSFQAARHFGLPVLWQLPQTKGVMSHEAWKIGATAVGTEYLGAGQLSSLGVSQYLKGMLSCLALWGVCPEARILPATGNVFIGDWQLASETGLFHSYCSLSERVSAGQELAHIRDLRGAILERFVAGTAGTVLAIRSKAYIRKGDWGVLVAAND
jgi:predicted deacylase